MSNSYNFLNTFYEMIRIIRGRSSNWCYTVFLNRSQNNGSCDEKGKSWSKKNTYENLD